MVFSDVSGLQKLMLSLRTLLSVSRHVYDVLTLFSESGGASKQFSMVSDEILAARASPIWIRIDLWTDRNLRSEPKCHHIFECEWLAEVDAVT